MSSTDATTALRCAWCGAPHDVASRPLGGRTVCAHCGVATTDPWPTEAELEAAYEGWYRPGSGRFDAGGDILLRLSRGALSARLDRLAPPGPILDVGCGDGHLVSALRRRGRRSVGIERVSTGPDVMEGDISDVEGDGTWAAVVFWHSLEHLPAPGHALDVAAKLLAPDGVLVVAVPNAGSWQAKAFRDRWFALDLPRHLVHIPARALSRRLARNAIAVERVSHYRGGQVVFGWLHGLVGALGGYDLYDAIRRPEARRRPMTGGERISALGLGVVLTPVAAVLAAVEVAARRGGTVYFEGGVPESVVSGERVSSSAGGFNPTFQRHVAAYRACAPLLPDGRVLDVGAGTGHSFTELAPRETVGVDLDAAALAGQDRETRSADMRALPFADASFASVLAVQSIEHVPDPERALAEFARVVEPGGVVVLVTPNRLTFARPDEIIDPYHYVEYSAPELSELCGATFGSVELHGLFGSERYRALVAAEHAQLDRLLRLDPLRLRRFVRRGARQRLYDRRLRMPARATPAPGALEITPEDFTLGGPPLDECLDLVAVCRS